MGKEERNSTMITVYHGGTERIEKPLAKVGRKNLEELSKHQPNNQICLLSQQVIDEYLIFKTVK